MKVSLSTAARRIRNFIASMVGSHARLSYSQEGEDLILERIFDGYTGGFYVDVGAHHPRRFSNTYRFYERGWRGINIEPNPGIQELFRRQRRRDINLCCGVAEQPGEVDYFMFDEAALNSFDKVRSKYLENDRHKLIGVRKVPVKQLSALLDEYLPQETRIDFMSIDVEGFDLAVLKSNDWNRFRPACVLVEAAGTDISKIGSEPVNAFLELHHFTLFAKTFNTLIYLDSKLNPLGLPENSGANGTAQRRGESRQ